MEPCPPRAFGHTLLDAKCGSDSDQHEADMGWGDGTRRGAGWPVFCPCRRWRLCHLWAVFVRATNGV